MSPMGFSRKLCTAVSDVIAHISYTISYLYDIDILHILHVFCLFLASNSSSNPCWGQQPAGARMGSLPPDIISEFWNTREEHCRSWMIPLCIAARQQWEEQGDLFFFLLALQPLQSHILVAKVSHIFCIFCKLNLALCIFIVLAYFWHIVT